MSDQMHLAELLSGFIGSCGLDPPFHMVAIGSNGRVRFSLCTANGSATELCSHGPALASPVVVTCISADGRGRSARIEAERTTMQ